MAERPARNPAQAAARMALLAPLVAFVFFAVFIASRPNHAGNEWERLGPVLAGVLAFSVAGIIATAVALKRMAQYGREGVAVPAWIGLVLSAVMLSAVIGGAISGMRGAPQRQPPAKVQTAADAHFREMIDLLQQNANGNKVTTQMAQTVDKFAGDMDAKAQAQVGKDQVITRLMAQYVRDVQILVNESNKAAKRFADSGAVTPVGMTQRTDVDTRLAILEEWRQSNDRLDQFLEESPSRLRTELVNARFEPKEIERYMDVIARRGTLDLQVQIRKTARDNLTTSREMLLLLKNNWGRWTFDAAADQLAFDDVKVQEEYQRLDDVMAAQQMKVADLQRELAARMAELTGAR